ncbi:N-acetylglucosaminyl-diphospho-decaprenol L-rhamnosyltransferase [Hartmannibacter diazotrophicus]|uniref:N-acetylglucosaminyl-diphospho-decaprenol L-rhamnosyltransferase n=1 Tax=Hartmannibacter diazotrophicus TaxID=1482074 RepID=A0A2C9D2H4_9HYPH|nr:glycosyltransferase family 2 protein [Hartmannibacter diazotrophicus]SON54433.1 N-acetylglucosaminyl-diphospho-decaprenol L-rhamnosyltransferase [Hartmannibacter diazotrophicus]
MRDIAFTLRPVSDVEGHGPRWLATSPEPWLEILPERSLAGCWITLSWSSGLLDPVGRPVVVCRAPDGDEQHILPAAPLGRGEWTGFVKPGTTSIRLSPSDRSGAFGFRIDRMTMIPPSRIFAHAIANNRQHGLLALGARLIGWRQDSYFELRQALNGRRLADYSKWRSLRTRPFERDGVDGGPVDPGTAPHIALCIDLRSTSASEIEGLVGDLTRQQHENWSLLLMTEGGESASEIAALLARSDRLRAVDASEPAGKGLAAIGLKALVAFVPASTRLHDHALAMVAAAASLPEAGTADVVYADEDRRRPGGQFVDPRLKPGFDPVLLEVMNYLGSAAFWRTPFLTGKMEADCSWAEAFDGLMGSDLRWMPANGAHVARIVLSTPATPVSEKTGARPKTMPITPSTESKAPEPLVSIIIPTKDRLDLLKPCIDSLLAHAPENCEVIVADNGSVEAKTRDYYGTLRHEPRVRIEEIAIPFNYSEICNRAAVASRGDVLVFLNNDTEFLHAGWWEAIRDFVLTPDVAAVGARLLFPSGKVQHAGIVMGIHGRCGHFEAGVSPDEEGYFRRAHHPHQLMAVTAAFLAIERHKFFEVNGFDQDMFPTDLSDVDFCLRLSRLGYKNVYVPGCRLLHHETASRDNSAGQYVRERAYFSEVYRREIRGDPYFSPILSLYGGEAILG